MIKKIYSDLYLGYGKYGGGTDFAHKIYKTYSGFMYPESCHIKMAQSMTYWKVRSEQ
jgi:hypothetical protein